MRKENIIRFFPIVALCIWSVFSYIWIFNTRYSVFEAALVEGWFLKKGLVIYRDYIQHHTPLLRYMLFPFFELFGYTPQTLQLISLIVSILFPLSLYKTAQLISYKVSIIALALFFILFFPFFNNFHFEEAIASLFTLIALYLFFLFLNSVKIRYLYLAGFFVGTSIMTKQIVSVTVLAYFIIFLIMFLKKDINIRQCVHYIVVYSLGIFTLVLPLLLYFFVNKALLDFLYYNIVFNFSIYRVHAPSSIDEALNIAIPLLLFVIPLLIISNKIKQKKLYYKLLLILFLTLSLIPALLPTFIIPRLMPLFPIALIGWSYTLVHVMQKSQKGLFRYIVFILIALFIISIFGRVKNFFVLVPQEISQGRLLFSYTNDDLKVVKWLKENTKENEKIYNMANVYITFLSERLPQNKYTFMLPWIVMPFDVSTKELTRHPPNIVISDKNNEKDPMLKGWKFLDYLQQNYYVKQQFGNIRIYYKK